VGACEGADPGVAGAARFRASGASLMSTVSVAKFECLTHRLQVPGSERESGPPKLARGRRGLYDIS